jgi:hypothetical protein
MVTTNACIRCPLCDYQQKVSSINHDGRVELIKCWNCDFMFKVKTRIEVRYEYTCVKHIFGEYYCLSSGERIRKCRLCSTSELSCKKEDANDE